MSKRKRVAKMTDRRGIIILINQWWKSKCCDVIIH